MNHTSSTDLIDAFVFAEHAHRELPLEKANAWRKWKVPLQPYIVHPVRVLLTVQGFSHYTKVQGQVALLHDVVEDTTVTLQDIDRKFGVMVAEGVAWLTSRSKQLKSKLNRAACKVMDTEYLARAPVWCREIKIADIWDNTGDMRIACPEDFRRLYAEEKMRQVEAIKHGTNAGNLVDRLLVRLLQLRQPDKVYRTEPVPEFMATKWHCSKCGKANDWARKFDICHRIVEEVSGSNMECGGVFQ